MLHKLNGGSKLKTGHFGKPICSLPRTQAGGRGVRLNRTKLKLMLLERKLARRESQVAAAVECCLAELRERIDSFRCRRKREARRQLPSLLKTNSSCEAILAQLMDQQQFLALEIEVKQMIQQQLNHLYEIKSVNIAAVPDYPADEAGLRRLAGALAESRRTVWLARATLKLGNAVWEKGMAYSGFPKPVGDLLGKINLTAIFLKELDCLPQQRRLTDQRQLADRVAGMIDNDCSRLLVDLSLRSAQIFYQLFDDVFARPILLRRARLLERLQANKLPYPSPGCTKQAG